MTINERIKCLRKKHLKMSQTEFAKLIGMKQTSVSSFEKLNATVTEQTIKSICLAVNGLNENWLRYGTEPIYSMEKFNFNDFFKQCQATDMEIEFIKTYLKLDPNLRKMIINYFKNHFSNIKSLNKTPEELEDERLDKMSVAELEEEYKKTILKAALKKKSTVSSSIVDLPSDNVG